MSIKTILIQVLLLAWLFASVITSNSALLNAYIATTWVIILFSLVVTTLTLILVNNPSILKNEQKSKLKKSLDKNDGYLSLVVNIVSILIIAYSGWVFTAIFCACSWVVIKFFFSIIKGELNKE